MTQLEKLQKATEAKNAAISAYVAEPTTKNAQLKDAALAKWAHEAAKVQGLPVNPSTPR